MLASLLGLLIPWVIPLVVEILNKSSDSSATEIHVFKL